VLPEEELWGVFFADTETLGLVTKGALHLLDLRTQELDVIALEPSDYAVVRYGSEDLFKQVYM
jgi:hypothetical protein